MKAQHIRVTKKEKLYKLQGSKYVQSNLTNTFLEIKKDLLNNKRVLFSGTPCQVAGLYRYLGKKYDNLFTIDLVCHGVPSPILFEKYINWLENKEHSTVTNYNFRDKIKNDWGVNSRVEFASNKIKYKRAKLDPYFKAFTDGLTYRESCYNCQFAKKERIADITLADYWGIKNIHPDFVNEKGVSLVIVNSKKGNLLLDLVKNDIIFIESDIDEAAKYNLNLNNPSIRTSSRTRAYDSILQLNSQCFKKYSKKHLQYKISLKELVKQILPYKVKKSIKKIIKK